MISPVDSTEFQVLKEKANASRDAKKELKKRNAGRPKRSEIEARKKPGTLGRPKGDADAIKEYKARLLASPKSKLVLDSILNAALDDEHKNQAAAWKLLVDRLMPLSYFDKDKAGGGRASVNITITGVGGEIENLVPDTEAIDGEYEYTNIGFNDE